MGDLFYIKNADIVLSDTVLRGSSLTYNEKILAIGEDAPEGAEILDGDGLTLWPGLIDVHTHGFGGRDTMDGGDAVAEIAKALPEFGVTGFLPATVTGSPETVFKALEGVKKAMVSGEGAQVLGAHLEGPFLEKTHKGAHDENFLCLPSLSWLDEIADTVRLVTLAPELDGAETFIKECLNRSIKCSIGHTGASFEQCAQAIHWGALSFTHTYNAMSPLSHRQPGAVGAAMYFDCFAELICDNIHVAPEVQTILFRLKPEKLILITDAIMAAGLPDGGFTLGTMQGSVKNGEARLPDGTLAGSVLTMNIALRNFLANTGSSFPQASRFVSANPAELLGIGTFKGSLKPGYDADLVLFDSDFNATLSVVKGVPVYNRM